MQGRYNKVKGEAAQGGSKARRILKRGLKKKEGSWILLARRKGKREKERYEKNTLEKFGVKCSARGKSASVPPTKERKRKTCT